MGQPVFYMQNVIIKFYINIGASNSEALGNTSDETVGEEVSGLCDHDLRSQIINLESERDKLRSDVAEANQRAAIMAQEIDEQNAKSESAGA